MQRTTAGATARTETTATAARFLCIAVAGVGISGANLDPSAVRIILVSGTSKQST